MKGRARQGGFTLVEIMVAVAIVTTLAAMAIPMYWNYLEKARVARAIAEIRTIEKAIDLYGLSTGVLPDTLGQVGWGNVVDPWGKPYEYLRLGTTAKLAARWSSGGLAFAPRRMQEAESWPIASLLSASKVYAGQGQGGQGGQGGTGKARKDRFLVPINSDYDLYSKGKDGESVAPLTASKSRDDVVRANDGAFVGLATDF